jgi:hypothetical protein
MRNKAEIVLNNEMADCLSEQFDKGSVNYVRESVVLESGELINIVSFDGCDPFISNYIFYAGAEFYKKTFFNLNNNI